MSTGILADWVPPPRPDAGLEFEGRYGRLARLAPGDAAGLHEAFSVDDDLWTYLPYGPFGSEAACADWVWQAARSDDPHFFGVRSGGGTRPAGVMSFLRIKPEPGSIEVGHICLSRDLQRTRAASEAIYLMADWAFRSGYRRFEWKCDAANRASRRAAERFGFSFEGVFRQHGVVKGRNRDTAWFAMTDGDWQGLALAYRTWLSPENFDAEGVQRTRLGALTARFRVSSDPTL